MVVAAMAGRRTSDPSWKNRRKTYQACVQEVIPAWRVLYPNEKKTWETMGSDVATLEEELVVCKTSARAL
jgi:hypothetical protein